MTVPFQECQYDEFPRGVSLVSSYHGGSRDRDSLRRLTLTRAHPHAIPVHGFQGASRVELDTVVPDVRLTSTFGTLLLNCATGSRWRMTQKFACPTLPRAPNFPRLHNFASACNHIFPFCARSKTFLITCSKRIFVTTMKMPITSPLFPFFEYSRVYILSKASRVCLNLIGLRCQ